MVSLKVRFWRKKIIDWSNVNGFFFGGIIKLLSPQILLKTLFTEMTLKGVVGVPTFWLTKWVWDINVKLTNMKPSSGSDSSILNKSAYSAQNP